MTSRSAAGQARWERRAPHYGSELRSRIENQATARYARWQARGRPPVWFRIKSRLRNAWLKMTESVMG
jgi:hypothetical protein